MLGAVLTFAINRGLADDNPIRGIKRFPERRFERYLSNAELARLGDALTAAQEAGENSSAVAAIRLLALTGCRKSEILSLRWEDVEGDRLRLPDSKTGAKVVPLGAAAREVLASLEPIEDNPYVFPSPAGDGHFVGLQKVWARIREHAGLSDVRLHDLRHSFASVGAAAGDSIYIIGKLLGHRQSATTQRYAHLADDPLRAAADRISGTIAAAMSGTDGAEVVELKPGR